MRDNFTNVDTPPVPPVNKYPFVDMKPGDYAELRFDNNHAVQIARRCAHVTSRKKGYKFVTRVNGLSVQVWCVERD